MSAYAASGGVTYFCEKLKDSSMAHQTDIGICKVSGNQQPNLVFGICLQTDSNKLQLSYLARGFELAVEQVSIPAFFRFGPCRQPRYSVITHYTYSWFPRQQGSSAFGGILREMDSPHLVHAA